MVWSFLCLSGVDVLNTINNREGYLLIAFSSRIKMTSHHTSKGRSIKLYLAQDGTIYRDQVEALQTDKSQNRWDPVIALLPIRLGLDKLNTMYYKSIASVFTINQSLGIIGGRPNASLYFFGLQGNSVYYLDPHVVQQFVNMEDEKFNIDTYRYNSMPNKLLLSELDPSLALGFYFATRRSFDEFCTKVDAMYKKDGAPPAIFHVKDKMPDESNTSMDFSCDDFDMDC